MFKKLKDKIAEEVKSSPQRIQQFAQAAQAAVTSASSSISDITNNDLFTIADEETPQNSPQRVAVPGFQDVSLSHSPSPLRRMDGSDPPASTPGPYPTPPGTGPYPPPSRVRRLSNSSAASDVSFRLPSYETPGTMYHLQSDLDVSASEMEDNVSVPAQLERVSKEHLYAAYRRTNEKYNKYRGRYTDLARHYRNLERENAKARAVLVETQDKALRRISELREQCTLEQSAKAHLESALRLELDERNLKIESLNTKIKLLQSYSSGQPGPAIIAEDAPDVAKVHEQVQSTSSTNGEISSVEQNQPLIDFSAEQNVTQDTTQQQALQELETKHCSEVNSLNNKIQKLEQLLVKCKETIKTHKDKNSQLTTEIQIVSTQLDKKTSEHDVLQTKLTELQGVSQELATSGDQIKALKEELDSFQQIKAKDLAVIKKDFDLATQEIIRLNEKIDILNKREEENVISLAENKLSVHKELETKEAEIKILKNNLSAVNLELKSNEAVVADLKNQIKSLEDENKKCNDKVANFDVAKDEISNLEGKINEFRLHQTEMESKCSSLLENVKCTELQLKQETDEKLAIMDRNNFLEGRIVYLGDQNAMRNKHIANLEKEILDMNKSTNANEELSSKFEGLLEEKNALTNRVDELVRSKESLENELNLVNVKIKEVTGNLEQVSAENAFLSSQLESFKTDVSALQEEKLKADLSHKNVSDELEKLRSEYEKNSGVLKTKLSTLEKEIVDISASNEMHESEAVQAVRKEMKKKIADLKGKMKEVLEKKNSEHEKLKEEYDNLNKDHEQKSEKLLELEKLKEEFSNLNATCGKYQEEFAELEKLKDKCIHLNSACEQYKEQLVEFEKLKGDFNSLSGECQCYVEKLKDFDGIKKANVDLSSEREDLEVKLMELEHIKGQYDNLKSELSNNQETSSAIDELNVQISNLNKELDHYKEEVTKLNENLETFVGLKTNYEQLLEEKGKFETNTQNYVIELDIIKSECSQLEVDKSNLEKKVSSLEVENGELKWNTAALIEDINQAQSELSTVQKSHTQIVLEKNSIEEKISQMEKSEKSKLNMADSTINQHINENESLKKDLETLEEEKDALIFENDSLLEKLREVNIDLEEGELKLKEYSENNEIWQQKLSNILDENNSLVEKCGRLKQEKDAAADRSSSMEQKLTEFDTIKSQFEEAKLEKEFLNMRVNQLESDIKQSNMDKTGLNAEKDSLQTELVHVTNDRKEKMQVLGEEVAKIKEELAIALEDKKSLQQKFEEEFSEKNSLVSKLETMENNSKNNQVLFDEKVELETQLSELREQYESAKTQNFAEVTSLQNAIQELKVKNEQAELKCREIEELVQKNVLLTGENERMVVKIKVLEQIETEHTALSDELHNIRSEKGKLLADIEGLQAHLTKVSKDNSQLNDRIREMIANGEVMQMNHLKNLESSPSGENHLNRQTMETQLNKLTEANTQLIDELKATEDLNNRLLDLERQNSILVEEKLELQDQIQSSMNRHDEIGTINESEKDYELNTLRIKNREMVNEKLQLEGRMADLELISRSGDSSVKVLEQKNEKLRLNNEKLERRLDEALVSLNHIHTLEENTELEYLRNILYEYLTGPTNNNLVLAKVLSAVVKFDQRQTQLVLEREKERQGVLGQLGLL